MEIIVDDKDIRLDQYLVTKLDYSRSKIEKLIKEKKILVNDKIIKKSYMLKENDIISITEITEEIKNVEKEKMDLDILFEDTNYIIVNKPNGLVVHPAPGNYTHTLVNGLMYHSALSQVNGIFRPGIVHRIDAYTTGLLVVAKNDKAHVFLANQLKEKTTHRKYIALVWGIINTDTGTIDAPIGRDLSDRKKMCVTDINAKEAITHFKVLERYKNATLIELMLETGRTHQIRVHMDYIGYPIVNDPVYGKRKLLDNTGQCLHAKELGFISPTTNKYVEYDSQLPDCFINILNQFKD